MVVNNVADAVAHIIVDYCNFVASFGFGLILAFPGRLLTGILLRGL